MIYVLEMGFTLLGKRNKLMLSASTGCVAKSIGRSKVYTALSINTYKSKSLYTNMSKILTQQSLFIIDELNMIHLKLLAIIDK